MLTHGTLSQVDIGSQVVHMWCTQSACYCCTLGVHVLLQLLGLLLPKYVPDEALLRQPSWVGVVQHADALQTMLQQHVIEPLLQGKLGCADVSIW